jgi:hypothetical protein
MQTIITGSKCPEPPLAFNRPNLGKSDSAASSKNHGFGTVPLSMKDLDTFGRFFAISSGIRLPVFAGIVRLNAGGVMEISRGLSDQREAITPGKGVLVFLRPGRGAGTARWSVQLNLANRPTPSHRTLSSWIVHSTENNEEPFGFGIKPVR